MDIHSVERTLTRVRVNLRRRDQFAIFAGILSVGTIEIEDDAAKVPTACTNGRDEKYGRAFIESLDDKMVGFVVLHEAGGHKMAQDLLVYKALFKIDPECANAACDYRINQMLTDLDPGEQYIAMPRLPDGTRIGLLDPKYVGWTTKEIFNDLRKQKEETGKGPGDNFDVHDWEGLDQLSEADKQALTQEVERAIAQGKIAKDRADKAGGGTGSLPLSLTEMLRPRVDWRAQLSDFVRSQCQAKDTSTWRKPNRRFIGEGIYIPTLIGERVGCAVVGYDTSSSNMSPASVQACMSEVKGLLDAVKPEATHLIYWDTEVKGHEVYTDANRSMMLTSTKPKGGGGTDPKCLSKYLRENHIKPDCIIMLTDGEISDWGTDWPAPILWVVINRTTYTAPVGKTIQIKEV